MRENRLQIASLGLVIFFLLSGMIYYNQDSYISNGDVESPCSRSYEIADDTVLIANATWTSRTSTTPQSFTDGDTLVGDHVIIRSVWTMISPTETPEYHINMTGFSLNDSLYETTNDSALISVDTYELDQNAMMKVTLIAWTNNGSVFTHELGNVTFHNFFTPDVEIIEPINFGASSGEVLISWTIIDDNADDEHFAQVLLSADGGDTFQRLAENITANTYTWNSSGFLVMDTYVVMVRVYDNDVVENQNGISTGDYWPGLSDYDIAYPPLSDHPQAPPSSTPTTSSEPTEADDHLLTFGLIGGVGIAAVVIFLLALSRKRSIRT